MFNEHCSFKKKIEGKGNHLVYSFMNCIYELQIIEILNNIKLIYYLLVLFKAF